MLHEDVTEWHGNLNIKYFISNYRGVLFSNMYDASLYSKLNVYSHTWFKKVKIPNTDFENCYWISFMLSFVSRIWYEYFLGENYCYAMSLFINAGFYHWNCAGILEQVAWMHFAW